MTANSSWNAYRTSLLSIWVALLVGGLLAGRLIPTVKGQFFDTCGRMGSSISLVALAFLAFSQVQPSSKRYAVLIAAGMVWGTVGDFFNAGLLQFIAPKNGTLGAIAAFGVGHVLYIIAIVGILRKHSRLSSPKTIACILFWQLVGLFSWYQIVFHAEKNETLIWPALGYCLLLAGTTGVASAVAIHRQRTWPLALGAALFLLSDLILAIGIFRGSFPFRSEAVWLTYGPGQMLIVISSWLVDRENR